MEQPSEQTEGEVLRWEQLSEQQKLEVWKRIKKIAKQENIGVHELLQSAKGMYFAVIVGHLHFATFQPIHTLDF